MNKNFPLLVCLVVSMAFLALTSCGNDDDNESAAPYKMSASISDTCLVFGPQESTKQLTINVVGAASTLWKIYSENGMCTFDQTWGVGDGTYTINVTCSENMYDEDRNSRLIISISDQIDRTEYLYCTVRQCGWIPTEQAFIIDNDGGTINVDTRQNLDYSFSLADDAKGWIHASKTGGSAGGLKLVVDANSSTRRDGHVTIDYGIAKQTVVVTQTSNISEGHEYVDLGLSVNWAMCNVGAFTAEEYGDYYAWGEVYTKDEYNLSTYFDPDAKQYGKDRNRTLKSYDDVAQWAWGGDWRMPTPEEQDELKTKCTWEWTTLNGVKGCKVTGPNNNYIFLPAAGTYSGKYLNKAGEEGYYWSNELYYEIPVQEASAITFNSEGFVYDFHVIMTGSSVRPVLKK